MLKQLGNTFLVKAFNSYLFTSNVRSEKLMFVCDPIITSKVGDVFIPITHRFVGPTPLNAVFYRGTNQIVYIYSMSYILLYTQ